MSKTAYLGLLVLLVGGSACADDAATPLPTTVTTTTLDIAKSYRLHDAIERWAKAHAGKAPTPEEWRAIVDGAFHEGGQP